MKFLRYPILFGFLVMMGLSVGCAGGPHSPTVGEHVDDSLITTKVKATLLRDSEVDGLDIHVKTYKGHVLLSGFVNQHDQIKRAEELAREIEGVTSVTNNLVIKSRS
jgi:hyperosmotically inducible periplasmic protein